MSYDLNITIIQGRLTADPVIKSTPSGKSVLNFTIACQEDKDKVNFINCTAWDKSAEFLANNTAKGCRVVVTGKYKAESYTDNEGNKKYKNYVLVLDTKIIDWKKKEGEQISGEEGFSDSGFSSGF